MSGQRPGDYFQEIERLFVELRAGALYLTPADWEVACGWEERGIPLSAALAGIRATLSRGRRVSPRAPLRLCSAAVETAWSALRREAAGSALRPAAADGYAPIDSTAGTELARLAASLREWTPRGEGISAADAAGELRSAALEAAEKVAALSGDPEPGCEARLTEIEAELLDRIETTLAASVREQVAADASRSLAAYRSRMPESSWETARVRAVRRRVGERFGVPPLTLSG